ncbi:MAG TPA: hypothetical protein VHD56_10955 [Tepidisphaeraceae bacterium]|nr:hypothetical protein [Tepidisphaeraceae bacterium]
MPKAAQARTRPRFGDVIEIETAKGLAYALYTHRHTDPPRWGAVLRVMPGIFKTRPEDFAILVELEPQFITFFPLGAACNRHLVSIVASVDIPEHAKAFPTFRSRSSPGARPGSQPYYFWDGKQEWKQNKLLPGQENFPIQQIVNDTMLKIKIEKGWHHRDAL